MDANLILDANPMLIVFLVCIASAHVLVPFVGKDGVTGVLDGWGTDAMILRGLFIPSFNSTHVVVLGGPPYSSLSIQLIDKVRNVKTILLNDPKLDWNDNYFVTSNTIYLTHKAQSNSARKISLENGQSTYFKVPTDSQVLVDKYGTIYYSTRNERLFLDLKSNYLYKIESSNRSVIVKNLDTNETNSWIDPGVADDLVIDSQGSTTFFTGYSQEPLPKPLQKRTKEGELLWSTSQLYQGRLKIDENDYIYLVQPFCISKFHPDGTLMFTRCHNDFGINGSPFVLINGDIFWSTNSGLIMKMVDCTPGQFANISSVSCEACPIGHASTHPDSYQCKACSPGRYMNITGATQCHYCLPGTYSIAWGTSTCDACPYNTFNPMPGATHCFPCGLLHKSSPASTSCHFIWTELALLLVLVAVVARLAYNRRQQPVYLV